MELSIFLARLLGPFFCVLGLTLLFQRDFIQKVALEIVQNPALLYLSGACRLFFGLILIGLHNAWIQSWEVLITLLGWLLVFKGAFTLLFPKVTLEMVKPWVKKPGTFLFGGLLVLLLGIFFSYQGYYVFAY